MKAVAILAVLAIASPAFAQVPAEKQSVPVQDKKPFLYDGLMPDDSGPPARDNPGVTLTIGETTITRQPLPEPPQPSPQSPKTSAG